MFLYIITIMLTTTGRLGAFLARNINPIDTNPFNTGNNILLRL